MFKNLKNKFLPLIKYFHTTTILKKKPHNPVKQKLKSSLENHKSPKLFTILIN
jgi:hypothetical protein